MASGHVNRIKRPDTWLHRPMLRNVKKVLANPEPSTHDPYATLSALNDNSVDASFSPYRGARLICQERGKAATCTSAFPRRAYAATADVGTRPSCSSIVSLSNIRLNETCLPSRKRRTWI